MPFGRSLPDPIEGEAVWVVFCEGVFAVRAYTMAANY
jgi:hypothetical protein